jgi:hypothetical protein
MEGYKFLRSSQVIILGVCIAAATIFSSIILSQGFLKLLKFKEEVITVTGSAQRAIKSDYIVWAGSFSRQEVLLADAYKKLGEDLVKVKAYLISKGVNEKDIIVSQIITTPVYRKNEKGNNMNDVESYILNQSVEIDSTDVDKVTDISRESTELINQGIEFQSYAPEYFYTKLDELKVEMLAKATENAKERAINMVKATGNSIGFIRSAKMGVFQITPLNSTVVSDWGENDTTSLDKKVTGVVSASFAIK